MSFDEEEKDAVVDEKEVGELTADLDEAFDEAIDPLDDEAAHAYDDDEDDDPISLEDKDNEY